MSTRIAIVDSLKCKPKKCKQECKQNCPVVRMGKLCIDVTPTSSIAQISESLCNGCGICVKKCPFNAIKIINLPDPITVPVSFRYGKNGFQLHRLPQLRRNHVTGIIGVNGIGKSTIVRILADKLRPNFGQTEPKSAEEIIQAYCGSDLQNYFSSLYSGDLRVRVKPQMIEQITKIAKYGDKTIQDLISDEKVLTDFDLAHLRDRLVKTLSGGEAQRLAIAMLFVSDANVLFFDEPTNYLDVRQRLRVSEKIQELATRPDSYVMVVDHDLAMLDFMSDYVTCLYGQASAYGIVSLPYTTREGINAYLRGYIPSENVRIRDSTLKFMRNLSEEEQEEEKGWQEEDAKKNKTAWDHTYEATEICLDKFKLNVKSGGWNNSEVVLIVGQNGTGKTTLVRYMAGLVKGTRDPQEFHVSYKPQHLSPKFDGTVAQLLTQKIGSMMASSLFRSDVLRPLQIDVLMDCIVKELSGGELQRVSLALALGKPADLYLLDEPSSFLDVEMRMAAATAIRRFIKHAQKTCLVVEHDLLMGMYMSDRVITFSGTPGIECVAHASVDKETGMNRFLRELNVTIRQDPETLRPRVNKPNSVTDREQKESGQYYMIRQRTEKTE